MERWGIGSQGSSSASLRKLAGNFLVSQFYLQASVEEKKLLSCHSYSVGFTPDGVQEEETF